MFGSRSDAILIHNAGKAITSDRPAEMIPTGGQTEAVRPGYDLHPGSLALYFVILP